MVADELAAVPDPEESADDAGLRYVRDDRPGIRRLRTGKGFRYVGPDGAPVHDARTLERIRSLAIPPAWTDVWICPSPRGYLQATGRDAKGRKQYRYHPRWRAVRDETKYGRLIAFARALPGIRERVRRDQARPGLPRERVLATVVRLLDVSHIRVGNEEYARQNGSYGLTTLRTRHADVSGACVRFHFRGKAGKQHNLTVRDRRLARVVQRCRDLPGYELFQYLDEEGRRHSIDAGDVNDYLRQISGQPFTAKDFRTWAGTVLAMQALAELPPSESETQAKRNVVQAVARVAAQLGNTPAVCRRCYIHPAVLERYAEGKLTPGRMNALSRTAEALRRDGLAGLEPEEAVTLALLELEEPSTARRS